MTDRAGEHEVGRRRVRRAAASLLASAGAVAAVPLAAHVDVIVARIAVNHNECAA